MGQTKRNFTNSYLDESPLDKIARLQKDNLQLELKKRELENKLERVHQFVERMKNEYPKTY